MDLSESWSGAGSSAECHTVTMEEGPHMPHELVIGKSLVPIPDGGDQEDKENEWMTPIQEKGPHYPDELAK